MNTIPPSDGVASIAAWIAVEASVAPVVVRAVVADHVGDIVQFAPCLIRLGDVAGLAGGDVRGEERHQ